MGRCLKSSFSSQWRSHKQCPPQHSPRRQQGGKKRPLQLTVTFSMSTYLGRNTPVIDYIRTLSSFRIQLAYRHILHEHVLGAEPADVGSKDGQLAVAAEAEAGDGIPGWGQTQQCILGASTTSHLRDSSEAS